MHASSLCRGRWGEFVHKITLFVNIIFIHLLRPLLSIAKNYKNIYISYLSENNFLISIKFYKNERRNYASTKLFDTQAYQNRKITVFVDLHLF